MPLDVVPSSIEEKIRTRTAHAAVIGLGCVGLPLAVGISDAGFSVKGIDLSREKVQLINSGNNYIKDVSLTQFSRVVNEGKLSATSDFSVLRDCDFISVCVPTPLAKGKSPDVSYIVSVVQEICSFLRWGQTIVLESTTYPGTTSEVVLPLLEETGLRVGSDFHLAFSPERIDPGNNQYGLRNTPKVIGGVTERCTELARQFYSTFVDTVIPVSSTRAAEMVKLLENTFRAVNIGLANEIAIMCNRLGIDTWEVIEAAASKPFGFMPFFPGPGLGGHCIPVDPHYLLWKMKSMDYDARFIQLADEINSAMPRLVVEKITDALNVHSKAVKGSKILVLGVAYKKDIDDYRESPAFTVIKLLQEKGAIVSYHDPFIPYFQHDGIQMESAPLTGISYQDCVVLLTHHTLFEIQKIIEEAKVFIDTRNASKGMTAPAGKIVKI